MNEIQHLHDFFDDFLEESFDSCANLFYFMIYFFFLPNFIPKD